MKKVVLLGDSIRQLGYGKKVAELLKDEYDVWQPEDNCRFAKYTQRMLFDYKANIDDADIIHWNNGHWDLCTINADNKQFSSMEEYLLEMDRLSDMLLKITPHVIFATTTPVRAENPYNSNEVAKKANRLVSEMLKKKGIIINDLYQALEDDINGNIREDDMIHLTEKGIDIAAKQVASYIKSIK